MFQALRTWFGLARQPGVQNPGPGTYPTESPVSVTFDSAMQLSAVWACSRLIAETIASLPLGIYRKTGPGRELDTSSDLAGLFSGKLNRYQTRCEFFETTLLNLVMRGNAYALKQKVGERLVGLLPLMAGQVETHLLKDGSVVHLYSHDQGVTAYADESIWHLKLFGNGIIGLSPLSYARNTMGVALAGEARVSKIFQNGGKPTGVLMYDHVLKAEQRAQIRKEFDELREGNTDRLMVLEAGMKYQQVSMTPQDIQLLESRRFQIEDIARFFGVPSVLINDTSGSTTWGSGIYEIVQGFHKLNLRPYLGRIEQSIVQNLAQPADRTQLEAVFDLDELLRGDMPARMEGYNKGINSGVLKPNDARRKEHLPPEEGGEQLFVNGNMIPLAQAAKGNRLLKPQAP